MLLLPLRFTPTGFLRDANAMLTPQRDNRVYRVARTCRTDTSQIAVHPVNLCPIQSNGAASHSRPRKTILYNETADGKRYLCI